MQDRSSSAAAHAPGASTGPRRSRPATGADARREPTLSIRLMWPFVRVTRADPNALSILDEEGISLRDFANAETRIRFDAVVDLLERAVELTGERSLGLRAGEAVEPGDLGVVEHAARSCATLREAIQCTCRYHPLLNGGADMMLIEEEQRAIWRWRAVPGVRSCPAISDYVLTLGRMCIERYSRPPAAPVLEVHVTHDEPTDAAEYRRIFGGRVRTGMPDNALVLPRAQLDQPMRYANPGMRAAFVSHADEMLRKLDPDPGVAGHVRQILLARVRSGDTGMVEVSHSLGMSPATMRRRLQEEGTSHSALLDDVRRDLARMYLAEPSLPISEVALLLGFAHVTAFYKAFRRWEDGATPAEFRDRYQNPACR